MEPLEITKESVARQLVQKHEKTLVVIREEFEKYSALERELDTKAEKLKTERDSLNKQVQTLKDERQNYYIESSTLRKEFMEHAKKKKSMGDIPMEVLILTKQIDQIEWEIQTEAMSMDDEKRLVKNIQDNIDKLHEYANKYQDLEEVSKAVKKLTSKLNQRLRQARERHEEMLKSVSVSDDKHKGFVDAVMKLRDARAKRIGFQHDRDRHTKALEHWQKIAETEARKNLKKAPQQQKMSKSNSEKSEPKSKPKEKPKPTKDQAPKKDKDVHVQSPKPKTESKTEPTENKSKTESENSTSGVVGNGK